VTALVLIAKQPVAGRVKTRLHPPLSLEQAAAVAAAAIDDTIAALAGVPATRRILLFDGEQAPAAAGGYEVVPQASGGLDERLAAIFDALDEPTVLVGMDTPQLTATHLAPAFAPDFGDRDAWFGPAADGGFWALGMRVPRGDLIRGVPMSQNDTGAKQLARLDAAGLRTGTLATLTDVDTIDSARAVAAAAPDGRFGRLVGELVSALDAARDD
jgi:uncharacterized protein